MKAPSSPMRVPLSPALRKRLERFAEAREIDLSTAASLLLTQQLNELDDDAQLARAEKWQAKQAAATWEKVKAGTMKTMPLEEFMTRLRSRKVRQKKKK